MHLYLILIVLFFWQNSSESRIVEIRSLSEISVSNSESLYLLDIDDTLIDSPYMLGSKAWRTYIRALGKKCEQDWHDQFSYHLAKNYPVAPVEHCTSVWVRDLQTNRYAVIGLTARERTFWYDTPIYGIDALSISQLKIAGITFDQERIEELFPEFINEPHYFEGVFFVDTHLKGPFLKNLLLKLPLLPKRIIYVDDSFAQIESVDKALHELQIDHVCYWYKACKAKELQFDPLVADTQLYFFLTTGEILSDEEAHLVSRGPINHAAILEKVYQTKN